MNKKHYVCKLVKNVWEDQRIIHGYDFERQTFGVKEERIFQTKGSKRVKAGAQGGPGVRGRNT